MALRDYQKTGKKQASDALVSGQTVILCMPTGSGKTVTFADMAKDAVNNGFPVMIAVDRKELLSQARAKLIEYGLNPSIITAGRSVKHGKECYIATVQTLKKRVFPEVGLLIIDEAHKQIFDPVVKIYKEKGCYIIGATATPKRTGKMGQMSDLYNSMVEPVSISQLIADGFLVPAISYGAPVDTSKIKIKGNDFDSTDMFNNFDKATLYADVVDKYQKHAPSTKFVCFCINVEHSKKTVAAFLSAGINTVHLDGETPANEREGILEAFSKGHIEGVCNVDVLTTGFDEWTIETVIVNQSTQSLPKWLQMAGRGSRITPDKFKDKAGYLQKTHFNLIDMGGNIFSLGFWESEREYSLTHKTKEKLDAAPVKLCPPDMSDINGRFGCESLLHLSAVKCKFCGYLFPEKEEAKPVKAEFIQLQNTEFLPEDYAAKPYYEMNVEELEQVRQYKGYKQGWVIIQILLHELSLLDYANFMGYDNPQAWVDRMETIYKKPKTA